MLEIILIWLGLMIFCFIAGYLIFYFENKYLSKKQNTEHNTPVNLTQSDLENFLNSPNKGLSFETNVFAPKIAVNSRGSWRIAQGNIYTKSMFEKDFENEFSQQLK